MPAAAGVLQESQKDFEDDYVKQLQKLPGEVPKSLEERILSDTLVPNTPKVIL